MELLVIKDKGTGETYYLNMLNIIFMTANDENSTLIKMKGTSAFIADDKIENLISVI